MIVTPKVLTIHRTLDRENEQNVVIVQGENFGIPVYYEFVVICGNPAVALDLTLAISFKVIMG